jgi:hypothetical protein
MPTIKSQIGQGNIPSPQGKVYTVSNVEEDSPEMMNPLQVMSGGQKISNEEAALMRSKMLQQKGSLNQDARRRIDIITGIGRRTKDVEVVQADSSITVFTLRTLKGVEQKKLIEVIEGSNRASMPNGELIIMPTSLYLIRLTTLKYSLSAIDGIDVDIVLGCSDQPFEQRVEARKELLEDMDDALTAYLYSKYQELHQETADGYVVKTDEEAKAVVNAISKSGSGA